MRKLSAVVIAFLVVSVLHAQDRNYWTRVNESSLNKDLFATRVKPSTYHLFQLNESALTAVSRDIPSERSVTPSLSSFILAVPNSQGNLEHFRVAEAPGDG